MKVQLEIPDKELYFLDVPGIYQNFTIVNYGYAGTYIMETDSKSLNHWKGGIPNGNYEVLGFVKDIIIGEIKSDKNFVLRKH